MRVRSAMMLCGLGVIVMLAWLASGGNAYAASSRLHGRHAAHTRAIHHTHAHHVHHGRHAALRSAAHRHGKRHRHRARRPPKPMVVIDPGHGGKDPGAIGVTGTQEKTVTLAIALELRRQLLATGRYRVAMTRTDDRFVSLPARVAFARAHHAALMIAIHANSSPDHRAHGVSVYVRSLGPHGAKVTHVAADPGAIGHALAGPPSRPGSALLQYTMIDNLDDDLRMAPDPARRARYYVLGLHDTPSVLLEMGFLSNRRDEALLRQKRHRRMIARALRDAVDDYFDDLKHATDRT